MEIFAYDYEGNKKVGSINDDFDYLEVEVISGNEHVYAYKNGGTGKHPTCVGDVDADFAYITETDGSYFVDRDEVDEWLNRSGPEYWLYERPYQKLETSDE